MQLDYHKLEELIQCRDIQAATAEEMLTFFHAEKIPNLPDGIMQIDPRSELPVIYNQARAKRPHDLPSADTTSVSHEPECVICTGQSTGIVDVAPIRDGYTFINKNLFPVLFPASPEAELPKHARKVAGLHFLQWTSTQHDQDWHNMPVEDLAIVLQRMAALESWCLKEGKRLFPAHKGEVYVSMGKNYGRLVGGSLAHGHQQITVSTVEPGRIRQHRRFYDLHKRRFNEYLFQQNPAEFTLRHYAEARLIVPYFMPRPYTMMLVPKDHHKIYLHELSEQALLDIARGWQDAIRLMRWVMPRINREIAYNVITHNGPESGLYFEFLPYTQENGCFEHMGLIICQSSPQKSIEILKEGLELL